MRPAVLVLTCGLFACGGSPVTPTKVDPPLPLANLILDTSVPFLPLRDTDAGWAFSGQGVNRGLGCAAKVRLTATFRDASQTLIETVAGDALPVQTIVLPNAPFTFEGCCMTRTLYANMPDIYALVVFQWDPIACPKF